MTKLIKVFYFLGCGIIIFCLMACEKKQEIKQTESPPKVVSKTIAIQPLPTGKKGTKAPEPDKVVPVADKGEIGADLKPLASVPLFQSEK